MSAPDNDTPVIKGTNIIEPDIEHAFILSINKDGSLETYDSVLSISADGTAPWKLPAKPSPATLHVIKNLEQITDNAQAVGRLIVYLSKQNTPTCVHTAKHTVAFGTAFYVAPNVIATAKHVCMKVGWSFQAAFFCPLVLAEEKVLEDLLQKSKYNFDINVVDPNAEKHLAEFKFYRATQLNTPDHLSIPLKIEKYIIKQAGVLSEAEWLHGADFKFLEVKEPSPRWFLPSPVIPKTDVSIALIGYATRFWEQDENHFKTYAPLKPERYGFYKLFDENKKFISAGNLAVEALNERALGHVANSESSSSGGPLILAEPLPFPQFLGIHVGAFNGIVAWNHAVHTQHAKFRVEWFVHVFPRLMAIWSTLSAAQREHIKQYLAEVKEVYPESYRGDVDKALASLH